MLTAGNGDGGLWYCCTTRKLKYDDADCVDDSMLMLTNAMILTRMLLGHDMMMVMVLATTVVMILRNYRR